VAAVGDGTGDADRIFVRGEITARVFKGACGFAEHVEAGGEAPVLALGHSRDGFVDGAAHDEDFAHHPHRRAHRLAHERLAGAGEEALQGARLLGLADQGAADHQAPGGRIYQGGVRLALMRLPIGIAELVGDQCIRGLRVRHAQEGFGEREEGNAFRSVEAILLQELVHPARRLGGAQVGEHAGRALLDPRRDSADRPASFKSGASTAGSAARCRRRISARADAVASAAWASGVAVAKACVFRLKRF
jgi:hypothetical protein